MRNPWKKISSKTIYKNPWIEIIEDAVIRPDGKPGIYGFMKVLPGVAVLPIDNEGYIYLINEYHYPTKQTLLKPVSGGVEKGETPLKAAKRELEEEIGILAKKWISLGTTNAFTSSVDAAADLFLAKDLRFTKTNPEGSEKIQLKKIKFKTAVAMALNNKIRNGNTIIILLRAYALLNKDL